MFEILIIGGGIAIFVYSSQQSAKLQKLAKELGDLKKQVSALTVAREQAVAPIAAAVIESTENVTAEEQPVAASAPLATESAVIAEDAQAASAPEAELAARETAEPGEASELIAAKAEAAIEEPTLQSVAEPTLAKPDVAAKPKESLESRLGARWTVWVGGLALAFGGLFMVKYSIENGLISPALRLSLAALFGLALMAGGEAVRRRVGAFASATFQNAMIQGVLTAAGSLTLMGSIFAAHVVYGYLGSGTAFALLALVSLTTVALSLMHGQALAGLGMLAAFVTPTLVHSDKPNPWALFVFLIVAWYATTLAARLREWKIVPMLANVGLGLWSIVVLADLNDGTWPITVAMLAMILGTAFIWPGSRADDDVPVAAPVPVAFPVKTTEAASGEATEAAKVAPPRARPAAPQIAPIFALLFGPFLPNFLTMSMSALLVGLFLLATGTTGQGLPDSPVLPFGLIVGGLLVLGAYRLQALLPTLAAAALAVLGYFVLSAPLMGGNIPSANIVAATVNHDTALYTALSLSALFIALGLLKALFSRQSHRQAEQLFATLSVGVPILVLGMAYLAVGNFTRDWTFGIVTLLAGAAYLATAELLHRKSISDGQSQENPLIPIYVTGSALAFIFALHAVTDGISTTLLVAALGFAYVMATRVRNWSILPWMMGLAEVVVLVRIGVNPSIVSANALSTTPFFNALLPGYGIPALLTAIAAYDLRKWPDARIRNFLEALASLAALLTIAILVRHAMNGGVLDSATPTLAEQSIYTLLAIGASAVLMTLDMKAPSPVFRWGSMAIGLVSMASILLAHFITLNPVQTGENTGSFPVLDLLLIAYLLPGLAALGLAFYAEGKRPDWYRHVIEIAGFVLLFVWVPLEICHLFHGANLAIDMAIRPAEAYLWPLAWLAISFVLPMISKRLATRSAEPLAPSLYPFTRSLQLGSLAFAAGAVLSLIGGNLIALNPYVSGDSTGNSAIFNLLLLGYCVPSIVLLLRALMGRRDNEPRPVVLGMSVVGLILMLAYITLVVRRVWQGEFIASWNGFLQGETYTYSVVWLIFGVVLLGLGSRLNAISLRLASAAIVFLTVVKVFLVDMSNLEGILRALSFIGLGLVLIAIGMFYQRILGNLAKPKAESAIDTGSATDSPA